MGKTSWSDLVKKMDDILEIVPGDIIKATKTGGRDGSIQTGDVCSGVLAFDVKINQGINLNSKSFMSGLMTTPVVGISKFSNFWMIMTENSVYVLEKMGKISDME